MASLKITFLHKCLLLAGLGIAMLYLLENHQQVISAEIAAIDEEMPLSASSKSSLLSWSSTVKSSSPEATSTHFKEAIATRALDNTIILVCVDSGYLDMALNLYKTSFEPLAIANYLYVGIDRTVCDGLTKHGVACTTHDSVKQIVSSDSSWGTKDFRLKTHFKTRVIKECLSWNYSAVISDVDIVFFKNPIPYFTCPSCDIEITNDISEGNSGFYLARPTKAARLLHQKAWDIAMKSGASTSNQKALDRTMESMIKKKTIKVRDLPKEQFPNGVQYFEQGHRYFTGHNPCKECVIAHNNWILSKNAKTYRFKEAGLWQVDTDQYYSSLSRKYLMYDNPHVMEQEKESRKLEENALYAALHLAHQLNRTLILPQFHWNKPCADKPCKKKEPRPLNSLITIKQFDQNVGISKYRESSFLQHPLVPSAIKNSTSPKLLINSDLLQKFIIQYPKVFSNDTDNLYTPSDLNSGPTKMEIQSWFEKFDHFSILRFHSLYGVYQLGKKNNVDKDIDSKFSKAIKQDTYRQI